jgi:hypothetical protein
MIERQTMVVTPAIAAEWLAKNRRNMPVRKDRVARIAKDLEATGKFQTKTPIALFADGTIYEGHTRLAAIEMAGIPIECVVETGYVIRASASTLASAAEQRSKHERS